MKKSLTLIAPIFMIVAATLVWGIAGAFFTLSFCGLAVSLFKDAQKI